MYWTGWSANIRLCGRRASVQPHMTSQAWRVCLGQPSPFQDRRETHKTYVNMRLASLLYPVRAVGGLVYADVMEVSFYVPEQMKKHGIATNTFLCAS